MTYVSFLVCLACALYSVSAYRDGKYSSLRLNDFQIKGSHNSYHLRPKPSLPQWEFSHESIESQLNQGLYSLEFDFFYDQGHFTTAQHQIFDNNSSCPDLVHCLTEVKNWFDVQDNQPILWIALGNQEPWTEQQWDEFETVVGSVWDSKQLLTPDHLRGSYPSVQQAIFAKGWPTVAECAGKIVLTLDQWETSGYYQNAHSNLEGRLAFPFFSYEDRNHSNAILLRMDTPNNSTLDAVKAGYIVRTRADDMLPNSPMTYQVQVDNAYFAVIDMNSDKVLNASELIQFHVYGVGETAGNITEITARINQTLQACTANKRDVSWGADFYCYQAKMAAAFLPLSSYPTVNQSYERMQRAIASGAHHISSDYPTAASGQKGGYYLRFTHSAYPIACNPITTNSKTDPQFQILCNLDTLNTQYYAPAPNVRNTILLGSLLGLAAIGLICMIIYQHTRTKPQKMTEMTDEQILGTSSNCCDIVFDCCQAKVKGYDQIADTRRTYGSEDDK